MGLNSFHWFAEFYGVLISNKGFNVIIGNPPYVEIKKNNNADFNQNLKTVKCGNLYAPIIDLSTMLINENGYLGMIVPISFISTERMNDLRTLVKQKSSKLYLSSFADRPGTLFNGVHQKTLILLLKKNYKTVTEIFSTKYIHWYSSSVDNERPYIFQNLCYFKKNSSNLDHVWSKHGSILESDIFEKTKSNKMLMIRPTYTDINVFLNMRMMYWSKCFINNKLSNEYKCFNLGSNIEAESFYCYFNSSLFFLLWENVSDCWHITSKQLNSVFYNLTNSRNKDFRKLSSILSENLEKTKKYVGTKQTEYEYYHKLSKDIIDRIDTSLAIHYEFSQKELDFIVNYNIKYRMGFS